MFPILQLTHIHIYTHQHTHIHTHTHTHIYIYIYIYYHPQADCFVLSELSSVARYAGRSKPGSKPIQLYARLSQTTRPTSGLRWLWGFLRYLCSNSSSGRLLTFLNPIGYIHTRIYIYIYISSACRAASTYILDPLSPLLPIVHHFWQVMDTSHILTELLYVGSSWSSCFCSAIGVHHLWARPCFSSIVLHVWFV